jgi:hypothetical protein
MASLAVVAGLVPAIHALASSKKDVDARHEARHDERELQPRYILLGTNS